MCIDRIVLGVGAEKANVYHLVGVVNPHHQPILVAGNIEHNPAVLENAGAPEVLFDRGR